MLSPHWDEDTQYKSETPHIVESVMLLDFPHSPVLVKVEFPLWFQAFPKQELASLLWKKPQTESQLHYKSPPLCVLVTVVFPQLWETNPVPKMRKHQQKSQAKLSWARTEVNWDWQFVKMHHWCVRSDPSVTQIILVASAASFIHRVYESKTTGEN